MSLPRYLTLSILALSVNLHAACPGTNDWSGADFNDSWGDPLNWGLDCVPTDTGDNATFNALTPFTTVSLDTQRTVSSIDFTTTTPYTITSGASGTTLILNGLPAIMTVSAGSQTLDLITLQLNSDTTMTVNSTLNFTDNFNLTDNGFNNILTINGPGTINNSSGAITPYEIDYNGGTLNNNNTPSISSILVNIFNLNSGIINNGNGANLQATTSLNFEGGVLNNSTGACACSDTTINFNGTLVNNSAQIGSISENIFVTAGIINNNGGTFGNNIASTTVSGGVINLANSSTMAVDSILTISGGTINVDPSSTIGPATLIMTGGTLVNNGTVTTGLVNPVFNPTNATVTGTGTFSSSANSVIVFQNSGLLIPGSPTSIGTLTIGTSPAPFISTFENLSNGTLVINVSNTSSSNLITESTFLDGTLKVNALPGFNATTIKNYTIITAPDGVTGTFATVTSNLGNFLERVSYFKTNVQLTLIPIAPALERYAGNFYESVFASINQLNFLLFKRLNWVKEQFLNADPCHCCSNPYTFNLYAGPLNQYGTIRSKEQNIGMSFHNNGFIVGADYLLTKTAFGFEFDYQRIDATVKNSWGDIYNNQIHFSAYGTYSPVPELGIDVIFGGGRNWVNIYRNVNFGKAYKAKGNPHGRNFDAMIGADYTFACSSPSFIPNLSIIPMASLQYITFRLNSYQEKNADVSNLQYERQKFQSIRSLLGINAKWSYPSTCYTLTPEINFAWQNEFYDDDRRLNLLNIVTGIPSSIEIKGANQNTFLAGIDLHLDFNNNYGIQFSYEFEGNNRFFDHFFYLGANLDF